MPAYLIIAFYKENIEEVSTHAEYISSHLGLQLKYQKLPSNRKDISKVSFEEVTFALFNRDVMGFRKLLKYVYEVPGPAILMSNNDSLESYKLLKIPVGYLPENKEKVVWANFWQKREPAIFLELNIPTEKDENIYDMVESNVEFMERVFDNSGARYERIDSPYGFEKMLKELYATTDRGVLMLMRSFRVFNFFIPPEIRGYKETARTPLLLIPRDEDLYVPCH